VDVEARDKRFNRTPLSRAAKNGDQILIMYKYDALLPHEKQPRQPEKFLVWLKVKNKLNRSFAMEAYDICS
jgi:hypothetical protein